MQRPPRDARALRFSAIRNSLAPFFYLCGDDVERARYNVTTSSWWGGSVREPLDFSLCAFDGSVRTSAKHYSSSLFFESTVPNTASIPLVRLMNNSTFVKSGAWRAALPPLPASGAFVPGERSSAGKIAFFSEWTTLGLVKNLYHRFIQKFMNNATFVKSESFGWSTEVITSPGF